MRATEILVGSWLADAVGVENDAAVAQVAVRLGSGQELPLYLRAGRDTAEWAYDRADVRPLVRHARPPILESWTDALGSTGHKYLARLQLPGRYYVAGLRFERLPSGGILTLSRLAVRDSFSGASVPIPLAASYVSDTTRLVEAAATPSVRLFEVREGQGRAWVVERLRKLPDDAAVLAALRRPAAAEIDPRREAVAVAAEVRDVALPEGSRSTRAEIVQAQGGRLELRAEGPGLLVVAEGWDRGWSASVDEAPARVHRVNHMALGVALAPGPHRVVLRHRARGLAAGFGLAGATALVVGAALVRERVRRRRSSRRSS